MYLIKRNNSKIEIEIENGILKPKNGKIGQRDTVFFICSSCQEEGSRRVSLFSNLENLSDRDFYCQKCNTEANNMKKYGVVNTMQVKEFADKCALSFKENNDIEEVILKRKATNLNRYGNEKFTNQEKREQTNLDRYGVKSLLCLEEIRKKETLKRKDISLNKLKKINGFEWQISSYTKLQENYLIKCNSCGLEFHKNAEQALLNGVNCPVCTPYGESSYERELRMILDNLNIEHIDNTRDIIKPYEIDIYIPYIKLGIEINGLYWHSEKFKNKDYHYKKYKLAKENGIELWQFFEDEWIYQKNIIVNKIKLKLGIYDKKIFARKCEIRKLNKQLCDDILNYHLIGVDNSSIRYGLFFENELISAMTFIKKKYGFTLNRFIVKSGYIVVGAFSKLLNHFKKNNYYSFIESFSENRYSYGDVYLKNGFKLDYETKPDYWYVIGDKREHKFNYRKKQIKQKFNLIEDVSTFTESDKMRELNINRIYNAGLTKWISL